MPNTIKVHGHDVSYEADAFSGVHYLNSIKMDEAYVFFRQAKIHGLASFEDNFRRHYTLEYNGGAYALTRN